MQEFGFASHGTSCADIAAEGNPAIRIMNVRMTGSAELTHVAPSPELAERISRSFGQIFSYLKTHRVRVVNMSWQMTAALWLRDMEKYGNESDARKREEIALGVFEATKKALRDGIRNAPEILFVTGAGNQNEETAAEVRIPPDLDEPNLISVGGVDSVGNPVSLTNHGPGVKLYAPFFTKARQFGGKRAIFVGTSASAPAAVNLAAKMLAVRPTLSPEQLISLMKSGATTNKGSKILLINPQGSMKLIARDN